MKVKRVMLILTMVLAVSVIAAPLAAPVNLTVNVGSTDLALDWDDVVDAEKYSVDIEGTVIYIDSGLQEVEAYIELSFGTSDRTDGGAMGDSDLTIFIDDLDDVIASELGISEDDLVGLDAEAKVKALSPGKNKGRQNNQFSTPASFSVDFTL
jgi:hypothetical protein